MNKFMAGFLTCYFIVAVAWGGMLSRMDFGPYKILVGAIGWPADLAYVYRADIKIEKH